MSETPPQKFVAYPRETVATYGTPEKLEALGKGYFGLSIAFVANVVLFFAVQFCAVVGMAAVFLGIVVLFAAVIALTIPHNKNIAYGKGWSKSQAWIASVLMGINSVICCGIIGYSVMQSQAMNEMKRYCVKPGFLGLYKNRAAPAWRQPATVAQLWRMSRDDLRHVKAANRL